MYEKTPYPQVCDEKIFSFFFFRMSLPERLRVIVTGVEVMVSIQVVSPMMLIDDSDIKSALIDAGCAEKRCRYKVPTPGLRRLRCSPGCSLP